MHHQQDTLGRDVGLSYLRDETEREIDFVVHQHRQPLMLVECKLQDEPVSPGFHYFQSKFPSCEAHQLSLRGTKDYQTDDGIRVSNALPFLAKLA